MSSQLLTECITQLELYNFELQFQSYFNSQRSRLLNSKEVAAGLVVLVAQEDNFSGNVSQLLGLLLDEARMRLENDSEYGQDFLQTVEMTVRTGLESGELQQAHLMGFAGLFRQVGLPVPQSFILDTVNISPSPDMENFDPYEDIEKIAQSVLSEGGTAYDLFNAIDTMLATAPEKVRASLANHLATMDTPVFERCALFLLLSGSELVQKAIITGLRARLNDSAFTTETQMLLPMIRGWLPKGDVQTDLDKLITQTLRTFNNIQGKATRNTKIKKISMSITDGVGAQNIAIMLKKGRETLVALVLLKTGHGIKDAFLIPTQSIREAKYLITHFAKEGGAGEILENTLRVLLEGALADGVESQSLPAPGFLEIIEECNMFDLRPQELELEVLLELVDSQHMVRNASLETRDKWCNDDFTWVRMKNITASWFEDTKETREIIAAGEPISIAEAKVWKFLENRRDIWARRFLQTAVMLRDSKKHREWKILTASAHDLIKGRPLKDIPLMDDIVDITFLAGHFKV